MQFKNENSKDETPYFWICKCDEPIVYSVSVPKCPDCGLLQDHAEPATVAQALKTNSNQIEAMFQLHKLAETETLPMTAAIDFAHLQNMFLGFLINTGEVDRDEWFERGRQTEDKREKA